MKHFFFIITLMLLGTANCDAQGVFRATIKVVTSGLSANKAMIEAKAVDGYVKQSNQLHAVQLSVAIRQATTQRYSSMSLNQKAVTTFDSKSAPLNLQKPNYEKAIKVLQQNMLSSVSLPNSSKVSNNK